MEYLPTIGLEIHVELKTVTKMFCDCLNDPEEKHPNINVCPICLGHPGTLPTINKKAVLSVIKLGKALNGKIAKKTKFHRKNYFYPDLVKAYQISQYDIPLVSGGKLNDINIRRIHLEEDTGTLIHDKINNLALVDYNRSGVPLMELVTEPEFKSAQEVVKFAKDLQNIIRYLEISDADMEKGEMRIEANVSLNLGTKVELKNINSFKFVEKAITYEIERQKKVLSEGKKIIQETRGWDDINQKTFSQRSKEDAHDYRYFPEPDLPPFETNIFSPEELSLPELPSQRKKRFVKEFSLSEQQAELLVLEKQFADYFEESVSEIKAFDENIDSQESCRLIFNYLTSDLKGLLAENDINDWQERIPPEHFAHLIYLIIKGDINSRIAKDVLKKMFSSQLDPEDILKSEKIKLVDNSFLEEIVKQVITEEKAAVKDYLNGKNSAIQYLIGKTMAKIKGQANPEQVRSVIITILTKIK